MSIAFWCVLVAGLMPFAAIGLAKWNKDYVRHNDRPREWEAGLAGYAARAHAAHLNCFEAFPLFAAGVVVAALMKAPQATVDAIAIGFIISRVVYLGAYLANFATFRSLVWFVGLGCSIALFIVAAGARG